MASQFSPLCALVSPDVLFPPRLTVASFVEQRDLNGIRLPRACFPFAVYCIGNLCARYGATTLLLASKGAAMIVDLLARINWSNVRESENKNSLELDKGPRRETTTPVCFINEAPETTRARGYCDNIRQVLAT